MGPTPAPTWLGPGQGAGWAQGHGTQQKPLAPKPSPGQSAHQRLPWPKFQTCHQRPGVAVREDEGGSLKFLESGSLQPGAVPPTDFSSLRDRLPSPPPPGPAGPSPAPPATTHCGVLGSLFLLSGPQCPLCLCPEDADIQSSVSLPPGTQLVLGSSQAPASPAPPDASPAFPVGFCGS